MNTYYNNSIDYHNDLDNFEARVRAEQAETELAEKCCCFEIAGDNKDCPVHGHIAVMAEYFTDYGRDYQERNDLYCIGMGG